MASEHFKRGKKESGHRTYYFQAEDENEAKDWVHMIKFVIEEQKVVAQQRRTQQTITSSKRKQTPLSSKRASSNWAKVRQNAVLKGVLAFKSVASKPTWNFLKFGNIRLAAHIGQVQNLVNRHAYSMPLVYVQVCVWLFGSWLVGCALR